jgi:hypothetical protein
MVIATILGQILFRSNYTWKKEDINVLYSS